jgi:hypothetical protein
MVRAVADLDPAAQFDFASPPSLSVATIYPAYVQGYADLGAGDGARAALEFQKLVDHPGMVLKFSPGTPGAIGTCSHLRSQRRCSKSSGRISRFAPTLA